MGAAIAYHLAERGVEDIVIVERDTPGAGSTSKAAGGVRCQFSDEVNIALAARGLEVLRNFEDRFRRRHRSCQQRLPVPPRLDDECAEAFADNVALQQRMGLDSRMLTVAEVAELAPFVNTEGLVAGAFNPGDGHCTPEAVVAGFVTAARERGVTVVKNCEVTGFDTDGGTDRRATSVITNQGTISCEQVVVAAGAWSGPIGRHGRGRPAGETAAAGDHGLRTRRFRHSRMPFTIDFSTSYYVHPEGSGLLFGCPDEVDDWSFNDKRDPNWLATLAEHIEARTPDLGDVEAGHGWAGLYEMTPDHNALIGEAEELAGILLRLRVLRPRLPHGPGRRGGRRRSHDRQHPLRRRDSPMDKRRFTTTGLRKELNVI
jgi:sarcosine oxidase subunit beta